MLDKTHSVINIHPEHGTWIYDAGKIIRSLPLEKTYQLFFDAMIRKMTPPRISNPKYVHIILDNYVDDRTKACARKIRGETESTRLHIGVYGQDMPSDEWQCALGNSETKKSLFSLFCQYILIGMAELEYSTIFNNINQTWMNNPRNKNITKLFECKHEEADTRMIYHASLEGASNVVLCANDSDVFILGTYACALDNNRNWFFNYEANTYSDLKKVAELVGNVAIYLPQYHALTGCDTTSYFYFRGKTGPWERAVKSPDSFHLIEDLGKENDLRDEALDDIAEFVRRFVYCGKIEESLVETKVRMYKHKVAHYHRIQIH